MNSWQPMTRKVLTRVAKAAAGTAAPPRHSACTQFAGGKSIVLPWACSGLAAFSRLGASNRNATQRGSRIAIYEPLVIKLQIKSHESTYERRRHRQFRPHPGRKSIQGIATVHAAG